MTNNMYESIEIEELESDFDYERLRPIYDSIVEVGNNIADLVRVLIVREYSQKELLASLLSNNSLVRRVASIVSRERIENRTQSFEEVKIALHGMMKSIHDLYGELEIIGGNSVKATSEEHRVGLDCWIEDLETVVTFLLDPRLREVFAETPLSELIDFQCVHLNNYSMNTLKRKELL